MNINNYLAKTTNLETVQYVDQT
jgi:hypothetical protein